MNKTRCFEKCVFNTLKLYTISYNFFNNYIYIPFISKILPDNNSANILDEYEIDHDNNKKLYFNKKEINDLEKSLTIKYYKISDVSFNNSLNCIVPCSFNLLNITLIHYGITYDIEINNNDYNFNCEYNSDYLICLSLE